MAGRNQRERIFRAGVRDRAHGPRRAYRCGNLRIAARLSIGNTAQRPQTVSQKALARVSKGTSSVLDCICRYERIGVIDDANPFVSAYAIQNAGSAFRYPCERFLRDSLGGAAPYSLWTDAQLYGDCRSDRRAAGRARGRERLREKSARADYALPSRDSEEWPTGRLSLGRGAQSRASSA